MLVMVVHLSLATGFVLLGRWGRQQATTLVWAGLPEKDRRHRVGAVRRGAIACYAVAAIVVLLGVATAAG